MVAWGRAPPKNKAIFEGNLRQKWSDSVIWKVRGDVLPSDRHCEKMTDFCKFFGPNRLLMCIYPVWMRRQVNRGMGGADYGKIIQFLRENDYKCDSTR